MTKLEKIEAIHDWYQSQIKGDVRLFKGRDNEMTLENIWSKMNHYDNLKALERRNALRQEHKAQIERAYYYNCEKWPLKRIREVYEKTQEKALI